MSGREHPSTPSTASAVSRPDVEDVTVRSQDIPPVPSISHIVWILVMGAILTGFVTLMSAAASFSLVNLYWAASGERTTAIGAVLFPLLLVVLPMPAVLIFVSYWGKAIVATERRADHWGGLVVPFFLVLGTVLGVLFTSAALS